MSALRGRLVAAQRTDETIARGVPLDNVARLLKANKASTASRALRPGGAGPAPGLVEPLTARELEVLGLLAAGRSNRDIAADPLVTLDPVRNTSAASSASSARSIAPRPSPEPVGSARSPSSRTSQRGSALSCSGPPAKDSTPQVHL